MEKRSIIETSIPIEGFSDPYFLKNTNGLYDNKIKNPALSSTNGIFPRQGNIRNGTYVHWQNSQRQASP